MFRFLCYLRLNDFANLALPILLIIGSFSFKQSKIQKKKNDWSHRLVSQSIYP